ncbi:MAG: hypothetical protein KJN66_07215 [Bacteroidia bacterium]|nr:hypothetical protein [Bacteroidia bacterium]
MQKLKESNLYRSELIPVSGKLVERYNKCLLKLGFEPSKLKKFSIDGIGWSPEISEEKKDLHYLNNGDANPHAIIISPLQKGKPVYLPFHSFDRDIMKLIFKVYGDKINDITRDCAICVDFDQNIDAFYEPLDILKYKNIYVGFRLINDLDTIQKGQMKLIKKFKTDNNFIDESIHEELLVSAKKYGDLRNRDLNLKELHFETDSFYTKAYGGVYVLRDFITPIVVFENEKFYKEAIKDTSYEVLIFHITQPELVTKLRDHLIIECDLEYVVKTDRYQRIKKYIFSQLINETKHPIKNILSDKVLFKSYMNRIDVKTLKKVNGVELYLERLERSNEYKIRDMIENSLYYALHQPHSSLTAAHQDLIWKLLVNISPKDPLFLYWYDKEQFYENYKEWDNSLKDWVIETIRNNI